MILCLHTIHVLWRNTILRHVLLVSFWLQLYNLELEVLVQRIIGKE